jgi:signal transduction histidine kinase
MSVKSLIMDWLTRLSRFPKPWVIGLSLAMAMSVGVVGCATGYDFHLTAFYLLPVCWVSWVAGRKAGRYLSVACSIIFAVGGLVTRHPEEPAVFALWNALMLLLVFLVAVYSVTAALEAYRSLAEAQTLLREANERLEVTVQRRTEALRSEMAERQRIEGAKVQAERMLQRQEKLTTLGTLTAGIAHEIRNPLTSLKARLYTLEKHVQTVPVAKKDTEIISAEISRLERIVQDALSFARPADPQLEPLDTASLLREVENLVSPYLSSRAVQLVVESNSELCIRADGGHLKQVLVNLIRNAAEAIAGAGTVTIRARTARTPLRGKEIEAVILEVSDSGHGILPEVEERLFDPFFTTKESGTGLGLPIAARIVEKHGGVIQYHTQPGKGTTFEVVLPRETGDTAQSGKRRENSTH